MDIHEYQAKELLSRYSVQIPRGGLAYSPEQATYRASEIGGGKWVVNPSGGLLSKGHPLGATGLAQCAELTWQLNGMAEKRQVEGARIGLQHNVGLGGACVVTMYKKD